MKLFISDQELADNGIRDDISGLWFPDLGDTEACLKAAKFLSKAASYLRRLSKTEASDIGGDAT